MIATLRGLAAGLLIGVAAALVVLGLAILPFLNPLWVGFEQDRSNVAGWTGYDAETIRTVTGSVLHDLVMGPPNFAVAVNGAPVLNEREREHMRDVRRVFASFYIGAAAGLVVLGAAFVLMRGTARSALWRRLSRAGMAIAAVTVVGGAAALVFFDAAFEIFHEAFFPAGSFLFDPRTERLVQLFPEQFWVESATGVGVVVVVLGVLLAVAARRRAIPHVEQVGWPA
jgi:integral membrane protein (TIGR01906 family)